MKSLYTDLEFNQAKSRDKLKLDCELCHNMFFAIKKDIQWALKCSYKDCLKFCSRKCRIHNSITRKNHICKNCGIKVIRTPIEIKKSKSGNVFCSGSCSVTYNNTHKKHGLIRSKLEIWTEQQLIRLYPTLTIHYNRKDAINSELDIYIPSLRLAFELNGIFHYEPIFGENKLQKTKNNDNRKFQACLEKQIELCIIDTSKIKYFKESTSAPILKIITNIINKKTEEDTGVDPDAQSYERHV